MATRPSSENSFERMVARGLNVGSDAARRAASTPIVVSWPENRAAEVDEKQRALDAILLVDGVAVFRVSWH